MSQAHTSAVSVPIASAPVRAARSAKPTQPSNLHRFFNDNIEKVTASFVEADRHLVEAAPDERESLGEEKLKELAREELLDMWKKASVEHYERKWLWFTGGGLTAAAALGYGSTKLGDPTLMMTGLGTAFAIAVASAGSGGMLRGYGRLANRGQYEKPWLPRWLPFFNPGISSSGKSHEEIFKRAEAKLAEIPNRSQTIVRKAHHLAIFDASS